MSQGEDVSRIDEMPVYKQQDTEVEAKLYNLWRRAKLHFPLPVRLPLPGLKNLVLVLEEHEWVCVDESLNDFPVIAWLEFEDKARDALHEPVKCKLNYYHYAASMICDDVLALMDELLEARLTEDGKSS
jgi:hypothetical protein